MINDLVSALTQAMAEHSFGQVANIKNIPDAVLLLKRQTWNTNRAIIVVSPKQIPSDVHGYLIQIRNRVAFKCGFFPLFWGIGVQVVVATGLLEDSINPAEHVNYVDNQWAIIQSVYLVDLDKKTYRTGRTWGQFITGKFQDAITDVLSKEFQFSANGEKHK
jgi:hypothetical protein